MILISKTPLRVSLFGGGTDFPEFFSKRTAILIGGSINKYIYIILTRYYSELFLNKLKFFYSKLEFVKSNKDIKHPVIKKIFIKEKITKNVELHIASDLPSNSGLGSSSSFTVGLMNLINFYKYKKLKPIDLAKKAIFFERNTLKECVGYQDQIFSAMGGFSKIEISKNNKIKLSRYKNCKLIKKIQDNLFLVFTGIKRSANKIESKKISKFKKNINFLRKINKIALVADKKLKSSNNPNFVGELLSQTWELKKKLDKAVSNSKIEKLYHKCLDHGATGGKLLGAGAGGFLLMYVPKKNKKKFCQKFKKNLIQFSFSEKGSEIRKI